MSGAGVEMREVGDTERVEVGPADPWHRLSRTPSRGERSFSSASDEVNVNAIAADASTRGLNPSRTDARRPEGLSPVRQTPLARLGLYLSQTRREVRKRRGAFCLGFTCVLLVVLIVAVADSALANTPVVFLNLARGERGDGDIRVFGRAVGDTAGSLNATEVGVRLGDEFLVAPRNEDSLVVFGDTAARRALRSDPFEETAWPYDAAAGGYATAENDGCEVDGTCFWDVLGSNAGRATVAAIDAALEMESDIGTEMGIKSLAAGDCLISTALAGLLGVGPGDIVFVRYDLTDFPYAGAVVDRVPPPPGESAYWNPTRILRLGTRWNNVIVPFRVHQVFRGTSGKLPSRLTSSVIVSMKSLYVNIARYANPKMDDTLRSAIASTPGQDYAAKLIVSVEPPRARFYADSNFDNVLKAVTGFASRALYRIGFEQVYVDLPLLEGMYDTRFFALFLGLILVVVVWILSLLSVLLIGSLMTVSVETRTFELGMMRMAGMRRRWIVEMLMTHASTYAVPAWALGLIFAQVIAAVLANTVFSSAGAAVNPILRPTSVALASALGLGIPILAAAAPIRRALGKSLVESLDTQRSRTKAVTVTITRSQDGSVSPAVLVVGFGLVIFGFLIVYVVPLALLSGRFGLLLNVFFGLLLGMMLGLVILSINVTQSLERLLTHVFFFWDTRAVGDILRKNLIAHRLRNRKTSMMYACTVGFIVFILVAVQLQITSFSYGVQQRYGTPIRIDAGGEGIKGETLHQLDYALRENELIEDVAYASFSLLSIVGADSTRLKNLGRTFSFSTVVRAVSPNLFDVTGTRFLVTKQTDRSNGWSIPEQLYTPRGSGSIAIGSLLGARLALDDLDSPLLLETTIPVRSTTASGGDEEINPDPTEQAGSSGDDSSSSSSGGTGDESATSSTSAVVSDSSSSNNGTLLSSSSEDRKTVTFRRLTPMALVDASPGFVFSKFPSVTFQNSLVSFPTMRRLCAPKVRSVSDIPIAHVFVKPRDNLSEEEMDSLVAGLRTLTRVLDGSLSVDDIRDEIEPVLDTAKLLDMFFSIVTAIAMVLCFFSLSTSMATNIKEQTKEIAILRAVGIKRRMLLRIYVYEAFTVVVTASLLGVLTGVIVGWTMSLQRALFTLRPIAFVLPTTTLIMVLVASVIVALLSSLGPASKVSKRPIVEVMREVH